jgi:phosphoglycolate phosphatase
VGIRGLFEGCLPEVILFDLDGTLIDSVPDLALALDHALCKQGYESVGEEGARAWVGNGARKLVQRGLAHALNCAEQGVPENTLDLVLNDFFEFYQENLTVNTALYDGVVETLAQWHAQGVKMACVTNKPIRFTLPILEHFDLIKYMPVSVGGDSLVVRKPDPAPLHEALRLLGAEQSLSDGRVLMVGDSQNDVSAARAAFIPVACVGYGYNHGADIGDSDPDLLVKQFSELA